MGNAEDNSCREQSPKSRKDGAGLQLDPEPGVRGTAQYRTAVLPERSPGWRQGKNRVPGSHNGGASGQEAARDPSDSAWGS